MAEIHRQAEYPIIVDAVEEEEKEEDKKQGEPPLWAERALFHFKRGLQGSAFFSNLYAPPAGDPLYFHNSDPPRQQQRQRASQLLQSLTGKDGRMTCAIQRKLLHDAAQVQHILSAEREALPARTVNYLERVRIAFSTVATSPSAGGFACHRDARAPPPLDTAALEALLLDIPLDVLAGSWRKVLHMAAPAAPPGNGNPIRASVYADAEWGASVFRERNMLVVDDFLTDDALRALRKHLLTSSIWNAAPKESFVGTTVSEGVMAHAVTVRLGAEITRAFPRIFCRGKRRMNQAWAYSYHNFEGVPQEGIGIHADESAINANLWIGGEEEGEEEEEAGDQESRGGEDENGLVVYDKEAPLDWDFKEYNNAGKPARARLAAFLEDAPWYNVKYRSNRLILFNGNLFHESMPLVVGPGFRRRRINLTLLFGKRGARCLDDAGLRREL